MNSALTDLASWQAERKQSMKKMRAEAAAAAGLEQQVCAQPTKSVVLPAPSESPKPAHGCGGG